MDPAGTPSPSAADTQRRVDELLWYHTIDVCDGVTTQGWFDLRHALPLMPFPDIRGMRCLDIGTWDGFYAYEMERRGAAEVVAIDVPDLAEIDYPPEVRADRSFDPSMPTAQPRSAGFQLLHELLDSKVQWRGMNIYDLDPAEVGSFDFVMLGSLLVHLRDPVRALDAVRTVTKGQFLVADYLHMPAHLLSRRRPLFELRGQTFDFQWWMANDAGLRQLLHVGGFTVDEVSKPFLLRPGPRGRTMVAASRHPKVLAKRALHQVLTGDATLGGHLHRAYLTHPRF